MMTFMYSLLYIIIFKKELSGTTTTKDFLLYKSEKVWLTVLDGITHTHVLKKY